MTYTHVVSDRKIEDTENTASRGETKPSDAAGRPVIPGEHLIGAFVGKQDGPTLIIVGSIHGNEPAGAKALKRVAEEIGPRVGSLNGRAYFLAGNTRALAKGKRFLDTDLNRSWKSQKIANSELPEGTRISEFLELGELDQLLDSILITSKDEVYVVDLHSTSAKGVPFATIGDTLRNRRFARCFPVTIVLGIEEQLEGTLLEYLNNVGAVTFGFEGGQHDANETVRNHTALIWLSLLNSGVLNAGDIPDLSQQRKVLDRHNTGARIFEVRYRHPVGPEDDFQMKPGFNNFDPVTVGDQLASDRNGTITSPESGVILMPLYQKLGEDGFFVGRRVAAFWLFVSEVLRRLGVPRLMPILPGVRTDPGDPSTLRVNTRIARLFPLQIFHLLGYRRRRCVDGELVVSRRKHDLKNPFKRRRENGR